MKLKIYIFINSDSGSSLQLHSQSSPGERNGRFGQNANFGQNGKVHSGLNVRSSAHNCGRVVDDGNAMAAI